jgi:hypothetical protein
VWGTHTRPGSECSRRGRSALGAWWPEGRPRPRSYTWSCCRTDDQAVD